MRLLCHLVATLALLLAAAAHAETAGRHETIPSNPALPSLSLLIRHSGMIFSGTALKIDHMHPNSASEVATTRITFRVETAIRGVRPGQIIQIREWDGLWNCGERYQAGERVLLFLFPTSRLGLTSPVGGRLGRFPVNAAGRIEIRSDDRRADSPKLIDLRSFVAEVERAERE